MTSEGLFVGLMSGTSMDGIDAALVEITDGQTQLKAVYSQPYDPALRARLAALASGDSESVDHLATLDRAVGLAFAQASEKLLQKAKQAASDITAIGSHGQTIRHRPFGPLAERYSLQIGDPASIAEITGITTVADFRRRDIAAGGQGAPLVPLFHAAQFGHAEQCRAVVNIGGISNATLLQGPKVIGGFDCGPGNTLLDAWIRRHRGLDFDADGAWSAEHTPDVALLDRLRADAYFAKSGPRSTGPELFNLAWLESYLRGSESEGAVQATLAELTAFAIVDSLQRCDETPDALFVCGGGARNTDLMRRLHTRLDELHIRLGTTDEIGLAAEWVEACAFAWLAHRALSGLPGNADIVTGAEGPRVLGAIFPA
ncbi:anhydro-N-acetylmuramic acid kinase [Congregibacter litoralis]|uniref:Anhydro-N-acetylmuramic acid kinase n=1 Tax=Congregibacter litoralis KT71 TaxID=314285 RepID=A4A6R4_9GAMM|nr:anhydro-N-acetylmuramic acid kinase [Congregibacter litoralis]EAQ97983.1 putative molecular chaperone distantly [Congregibacter litoralis KT71]